MEHSVFFLAPEAGRWPAALNIESIGLWGSVRNVCDRCQITFVTRLGVAHPLLGVLVAHSTLLNELDDDILHELFCLINE